MRTAADHPDPTVREAASERVERWQQVIDGMTDGTLRIGSRRPLAGLPAWVTLRVVRGGFATGKAAAAIPPAVDERLRARRLGIEATRQAIFESWLTPEGLAELEVLLETGAYNVGFPEHAVLLSVAALLRHGANDSVRALLDEVSPLAGSLRFSPYPGAPSPLRPGQVSRWTARQVAGALEKARVNPQVAAEREALTVWLPLTDKVVAFWAGIVETPAFDEGRALVGALLAAIYRAFRRRRSLLLLDLERQVRFKELPWVAALQALTVDDPLDDPWCWRGGSGRWCWTHSQARSCQTGSSGNTVPSSIWRRCGCR